MKNNDGKMPILFKKLEECCGCTACYSVCPMKAIKMSKGKDGFLYPNIDRSKCIKCYKCLNVCPFSKNN